jgi:ornithine carbamoyltransferase
MTPNHFLDIDSLDRKILRSILDHAAKLKKRGKKKPAGLKPGLVLAMIFEKPSTRTRVSFEAAMLELGGQSIVLNAGDMQLGRGESVADTARVLSRYVDAIMLRTGSHETLAELAANATVPVINGLTPKSHPCQVMADVMTFEEQKGSIKGKTIAWIGDANNVSNSWIHAAGKLGCKMNFACPKEFSPSAELLDWARKEGAEITIFADPIEAARGADCVLTDVWVSMGDNDKRRRETLLKPYRVDQNVMAAAKRNAVFMHCLPAHRGDEVTAEVIDGPQSVVWDEAENRLHVQKAILAWCLGGKPKRNSRRK